MPPKNDPSPFSLVIVDFDNTLTLEASRAWIKEPKTYPVNLDLLKILYQHHTNTGVPIQIVSAGAQMWHYIQRDTNLETCPFFVIEPLLTHAFHYVANHHEIVDQNLIRKTTQLYQDSFIKNSVDEWLSMPQEALLNIFSDPILYNYVIETHALLCFFYQLCSKSYDLYDAYKVEDKKSFEQLFDKRLLIMDQYGKNLMLVHAYLERTIFTGNTPNARSMQKSVFFIDDNSMVIKKADSFCQAIQYDPLNIDNIHPELIDSLSKTTPLIHEQSLQKNPDPRSTLFMAAYTCFLEEHHTFDERMQDNPLYPIMKNRLTFLADYLDMPCVYFSENIHYLYHLILFEQSILEIEHFESLKNSPYFVFLTEQKELLAYLIEKFDPPILWSTLNQDSHLTEDLVSFEIPEKDTTEERGYQKLTLHDE